MRILYVDGHHIHRELTANALRRQRDVSLESYFPMNCQNYLISPDDLPTLLQRIDSHDAILLDRETFDRAGTNFLDVLHQSRERGYTGKIFASTTRSPTECALEALTQEGQVVYIHKPFTFKQLRETLGL